MTNSEGVRTCSAPSFGSTSLTHPTLMMTARPHNPFLSVRRKQRWNPSEVLAKHFDAEGVIILVHRF